MHSDAVRRGQRVLVIDDVIATGGTAAATARLVRALGGEVVAATLPDRARVPGRAQGARRPAGRVGAALLALATRPYIGAPALPNHPERECNRACRRALHGERGASSHHRRSRAARGRGLEQSLASDELELRVDALVRGGADATRRSFAPALVILCLAGCAGSAAPRCAALRAEPALDGVPLLVAASAPEQDELARCLELGADDALVLPVHPKIAAARVLALTRAKAERETHAELARAAEQGQQAFRTTVDALRRSTEAMEHTERRKRYLETHDGLTGLANRAYFREFARRTMGYARRYGTRSRCSRSTSTTSTA